MVVEIGDSLKHDDHHLGTTSSDVAFEDVYELDMALNSGGFGTVHKTHFKTNRFEVYAVKVIERTGYDVDDKDVIQEAEILRQLKEVPSVVNLIDFYMSNDKIYMVQELARGGDILERVLQYGTYEESAARTIARTLLEIVDTMHTKFHLVHRDIKPENILLRHVFSETDIVLCDFGSARYLPKEEARGLVSRGGTTTAFSAPELLSRSDYRQEVDIWSIGCVLFVVLVGYHPFEGDDEEEMSANIAMGDYGGKDDDEMWDFITKEAKDTIRQMLAVDRHQRCTARQALQLQWFCSRNDDVPVPEQSGNDRCNTSIADVVNYAANTANKLAKNTGENRNGSNNSYDLFNDQEDHSDCYYGGCFGDASETEATAFTDSFNSSFNDDVLFVMGGKSSVLESSSSHSCSALWNLEEDDDDDYRDDEDDIYDNGEKSSVEGEQLDSYYTLEQLQKKSVHGLDYKNREKYLCEKDFKKVFGATRTEVATWKPWRVTKKKREKGLW